MLRNAGRLLAMGLVLAVTLGAAWQSHAEEAAEPQAVKLVLFDTIWKDFNLRPKMKKEIQEHMLKWIGKASEYQLVSRGDRDRQIMEKRIFVMGTPDLAKAEEISTQAGWNTFMHVTFKGIPRKGIEVKVVVRDLALGAAGTFTKTKRVRNHLKALRNTARKLAFDALKEATQARKAAAAVPAPPQ